MKRILSLIALTLFTIVSYAQTRDITKYTGNGVPSWTPTATEPKTAQGTTAPFPMYRYNGTAWVLQGKEIGILTSLPTTAANDFGDIRVVQTATDTTEMFYSKLNTYKVTKAKLSALPNVYTTSSTQTLDYSSADIEIPINVGTEIVKYNTRKAKFLPVNEVVFSTIAEMTAYTGNAEQVQVTDSLRGGTFKLSNLSDYIVDSGKVFQSAIASRVFVRITENKESLPRWYGAKGDFTTNDLSNLQRCIDFNDIVNIENYNYIINGTLVCHNNTHIKGNGTIKQGLAQTILFNTDNTQNVLFENVTLQGFKTDYIEAISSLARAISSNSNTQNLNINSVKFNYFAGKAIVLDGKKASVINCTFKGIGSDVLAVTPSEAAACQAICLNLNAGSNAEYIAIEKNTIDSVSIGITTGGYIKNISINKNYFTDIIGQHAVYLGEGARNVRVSFNKIKRVSLIGIKVQNLSSATIAPKDIFVNGNILDSCGGTGLAIFETSAGLKGSNYQIYDNTILNNGGDMIEIGNVNGAIINNNTGKIGAATGIVVKNAINASISNNKFYNLGENGMTFYGVNDSIHILNNKFLNIALLNTIFKNTGFLIDNLSHSVIEKNQIINTVPNTLYDGIFVNTTADASTIQLLDNTVSGCYDIGIRIVGATYRVIEKLEDNKLENNLINYVNGNGVEYQIGKGNTNQDYYASTIPTTGSYRVGDFVRNVSTTANNGILGWLRLTNGNTHALNTDWGLIALKDLSAIPQGKVTVTTAGTSQTVVIDNGVAPNTATDITHIELFYQAGGVGAKLRLIPTVDFTLGTISGNNIPITLGSSASVGDKFYILIK